MPDREAHKQHYPITEEEMADIENRHTYHAPTPDQITRYPQIREKAKEFEILIRQLVPPGPGDERDIAIKAIQTATFWANAGIARNEKTS